MKKVILIVISFMVLSTAVLFVSCSNKTNKGTNNVSSSNTNSGTSSNTNSNSSSNTNSSSSSKTFTVDELKKYNGQNGNPAYVAVSGVVYDVTNARKWKNGRHQNGIVAGMDLTSALPQSPHGDSVLKELPIVGKLK